jgi:transposase
VLDNLSEQRIKVVEAFLAQQPKRFHFAATYSSWLNQVEWWVAKTKRDVISRGVFTSVADLARNLRKHIGDHAESARPLRWTYTDPRKRIRITRSRRDCLLACDWEGCRIEVFDKMGNFRRNNVLVESEAVPLKRGRPCWMGFSPDPEQTFVYVGDCRNEEIRIMDRTTGKELSSLAGRATTLANSPARTVWRLTCKGDIIWLILLVAGGAI